MFLYKNNIRKVLRVHRLVAETFIPNKENKPFINHIDGNKQNNVISNLEWCTNKENCNHALKNGLCNYLKSVICIETNKEYISIMEAERQTKISNANIIRSCKNKNKTAGGYHWKYKD